jgi:hypothetical protein
MASTHRCDDAAHFRFRAEEVRTAADNMSDEECRQIVLKIADEYDRMASWAELRAEPSVSARH